MRLRGIDLGVIGARQEHRAVSVSAWHACDELFFRWNEIVPPIITKRLQIIRIRAIVDIEEADLSTTSIRMIYIPLIDLIDSRGLVSKGKLCNLLIEHAETISLFEGFDFNAVRKAWETIDHTSPFVRIWDLKSNKMGDCAIRGVSVADQADCFIGCTVYRAGKEKVYLLAATDPIALLYSSSFSRVGVVDDTLTLYAKDGKAVGTTLLSEGSPTLAEELSRCKNLRRRSIA